MDILFLLLPFIVVMLITMATFAARLKRVPPDQAMVVFGQQRRGGMVVTGGGRKFIVPIVEEAKFLDLSVRTLELSVENVLTKSKVLADVKAVCEVKISDDGSRMRTAVEMLLDKSNEELNQMVRDTMEGHLRAVCAILDLEELRTEEDMVAAQIQNSAGMDLAHIGMELPSFTIIDIQELPSPRDQACTEVLKAMEVHFQKEGTSLFRVLSELGVPTDEIAVIDTRRGW